MHCAALDGASSCLFFFQAEDGIRDVAVTGVQTCALPICLFIGRSANAQKRPSPRGAGSIRRVAETAAASRSEEHTSELQSRLHLVCRLLLGKKETTLESRRHPARRAPARGGRPPTVHCGR